MFLKLSESVSRCCEVIMCSLTILHGVSLALKLLMTTLTSNNHTYLCLLYYRNVESFQ